MLNMSACVSQETRVFLIPMFIGSTGSTCAKWNYTECSCLLMRTAQKHASFLLSVINLKWWEMGIRSGTAWLKESFVVKLNFVQKWHLFWMTGVIYLDALFGFPKKPWLVVKCPSCKKVWTGFLLVNIHVWVHRPSLCVTPQTEMRPFTHLKGDTLRDVTFLYMPAASSCQVIEWAGSGTVFEHSWASRVFLLGFNLQPAPVAEKALIPANGPYCSAPPPAVDINVKGAIGTNDSSLFPLSH